MVDRYTKVVLTIIAISLTVIAGKDLPFIKTATAQVFGQQPAHVVVDSFGSGAFNYVFQYVSAPLPVKIER
jgi:hypothetical protein